MYTELQSVRGRKGAGTESSLVSDKSMCLVNQHASVKLKHREVAYSRHS